jgi:hypothetical protein
MSRDLSSQTTPDLGAIDVETARKVLEQHYGERVAPVSEYCRAIEQYMQALAQDGAGSPSGERLNEIARELKFTTAYFAKSNLLYRLLYLGQPLRTEKCPIHDGHWAGCPAPDDYCPHGCTVAGNTTGWIS